jgi:hypothetical protein
VPLMGLLAIARWAGAKALPKAAVKVALIIEAVMQRDGGDGVVA